MRKAVERNPAGDGDRRVFISWSGQVSKGLALAINGWLQQTLQRLRPWLSAADLKPGDRWNDKVSSNLQQTHCGILCMTPENLGSAWLLFEAGACAKSMNEARVIPVLFGVQTSQLPSPLSSFQSVNADKEGFWKLAVALNDELRTLNEDADDRKELGESLLSAVFKHAWPDLEKELTRLRKMLSQSGPPSRSEQDVLGEVLDAVRRLERGNAAASASGGDGDASWEDYFIKGANLANNVADASADLASLRAYSDAVSLAPSDLPRNVLSRLYVHRAAVLKRLGRLLEAENDLRFGLENATANAEINNALYQMASVQAMLKRRDAAMELLTRLIQRDARWVDLVDAREQFFPDIARNPTFKKLAAPRRQSRGKRLKLSRPAHKPRTDGASSVDNSKPVHRSTKKSPGKSAIPTIACFNRATVPLGVDFEALIAALQAFLDDHVAPVWGTRAKLVKSTNFAKSAWALIFLDDADAPGALAYHDLTPEGKPQGKVFVKSVLVNHDLVSVAASHQLVEMLVDPEVAKIVTGPDPRTLYAYEAADPVEALSFQVKGIPMSDFVYPAYFEQGHKPGATTFDHLHKITRPFEILKGGYQVVFRDGRWTEIFGSTMTKKAFAKEDRRGHRSEMRQAVQPTKGATARRAV